MLSYASLKFKKDNLETLIKIHYINIYSLLMKFQIFIMTVRQYIFKCIVCRYLKVLKSQWSLSMPIFVQT